MDQGDREDLRLGELAVARGVLPREALDRALAVLDERRSQGASISLGALLVELGHLTPAGLRELLAEQGKALLACTAAGCGRRYNIRGYRPDRDYRCRICGGRLSASRVDAPGVGHDGEAGDSATLIFAGARELDPRATVPEAGAEAPAPAGGFGRYEEVEELARGGMGAILRATDPALERPVAIKVGLFASGEEGEEGLSRFLREAKLTGQLEHPNIVPIHELGEAADGRPYFAMKLVRGRSLEQILEEARGRPDEPLRSRPVLLGHFLKVCDAVSFAHSRGVIHRDLKPGNVMIGEFGEVLVMDWGLAGMRNAECGVRNSGTDEGAGGDPSLTAPGTLLGTPAYMSPEQASGENDVVDERSDVYSLGAVLYQILTLAPPHLARGLPQLLRAIDEGAIEPPSVRVPEARIPRELDAVVARAMARAPGERYGSVLDLKADIEAHLTGHALSAAQYSPLALAVKWVRRNRAVALGTAATFLAIAAGLAGMFAVERRGRTQAIARRTEDAAAAYAEGVAAWEDASDRVDLNPASPQEYFQVHLAAISRTAQALQTHPDPPVAWKEWVSGRALDLQNRAQEVGEWALAQILAELVGTWGAGDESERAARLASVHAARDERSRKDVAELDAVLAGIRGDAKHGFLAPGEPEERARRLARRREPAVLAEILARLARDPAPETRYVRPFLIDVLGRRGDLETRWGGLGAADLARRGLSRSVESAGADEMGAWFLATARLERRTKGTFDQEWLAARLAEAEGGSDPIVADAARRARAILAGRASAASVEDLADWMAGATASGSDFTSALLERAEGEEGSEAEIAFLYHLLGLRGDVRPPSPLRPARSALQLLRQALASVPDDWLADEPPAGAEPRAVERARRKAILAATNLSRLGDPDLAHGLLARRFAAGLHSRFWTATRVAFALAPIDRWPEPRTALDFVRRGVACQLRGEPERAIADFDRALELDPRSPDALHDRALSRLAMGDLDLAIRDLDRAIELDPGDAKAHADRSAARHSLGDLEGALEDAGRAVALQPDLADGWSNRGNARSDLGDVRGAIDDYSRAIAIEPGDEEAWNNRGVALHALGEIDPAIRDFDRALEINPRLDRAFLNRGSARQAAGDFRGAIADCERAIGLAPRSAAAWNNRGLARKGLGDFRGAIEDWDRAIAIDGACVYAYVNRGVAFQELGETERAIADFDHAIELDPSDPEPWNNRGLARLTVGDVPGALGDFDRAIELGPEDAIAWNGRGAARFKSGDFQGALADCDRALELDPRYAKALDNRGLVRRALGDLRGAVEDHTRAIEIDPGSSRAHYDRGLSRRDLGDVAGAAEDFGRALELDPDFANAWYERGAARQFQGDREGAIADYDRALELAPGNVAAWCNRALARRNEGDVAGAIADYDRALELAPDLAMAYNGRAGARRMMGDVPGALADFEEALRIEPGLWQAWANRGALLGGSGDRAGAAASFEEALRRCPENQRPTVEAMRREALGE